MSAPVLWEGSAFASYLATLEGEGDDAQQAVAPPDAAAAALLAADPALPEPEPEPEPECDAEASGAWGGGALWAWARQCDSLVAASPFGANSGGPEPQAAAGAARAATEPDALGAAVQAARWWLDRGLAAGRTGWLLSAALAAGGAAQLCERGRPRLAAAVGLLSLPAAAACAAHLRGRTDGAGLALLLQASVDLLAGSIDAAARCPLPYPHLRPAPALSVRCRRRLQRRCREAVRTIQEVELLARGYNVVPSGSAALPPISRLERRDRDRRCGE